jgi:hypothetical protein
MRGQVFRIAGQGPKIRWKRNAGRKKRTIEEAVAIARQNGVRIPDDVEFSEAEPGELKGSLTRLITGGEMITAKGPDMPSRSGDGYLYWKQHYNRFGKIPFKIHPEILTGDESIVGVFQHEMYELELLREVFMASAERRMDTGDYGRQVSPGLKGNFHDDAWVAADELVLQVRKGRKS